MNESIRFTTMDELIAETSFRLACTDTAEELIFRNWVYRAIQLIGEAPTDVKTECVEVDGLTISKPCDYLSGIDMNLLDIAGNSIYFQFTEKGLMDSENSFRLGTIKIVELDNCFTLSSTSKDYGIVKAELSYFAMLQDENGEPLIREDFTEAIHAYIKYLYLERNRNKYRAHSNIYPLNEIEYAKNNWINLKGMTRGNSKMPSPLRAEAIMRKWMSAIPNFKNKRRNSIHTLRNIK